MLLWHQPVQMKPLKEYVAIMSNLWSTPIDNKMIGYSDAGWTNNPTRRTVAVTTALLRRLGFAIPAFP